MGDFDYQDYILLYNRLRCDDVIFHPEVFKSCIGRTVPVVHGDGFNMVCLGTAIIEQDHLGVFAKCKFFDTDIGNLAKQILLDTDEMTISCPIYCVKRDGKHVISGDIRRINVIPKLSAFTYSGDQ